ncbi:multicomponent Na+:H+ antiporter subunit E [Rhizobium sp. BK650]|uniref:Na+/H+ antiporter subunit E n=1 Tax=Rhizobium sp. BK650 TaxID=2586990 RepID=UPI00160F7E97|nr:Na+/H+ antiporter subunit E [Rhizobium sp. BK650]MBB3657207.1 multicomponent Na+:H+ antiporter subunit E [Rhizobium sp. BK650]
MIVLFLSLPLALAWVAVTGSASPHNFVFGLALSLLSLAVVRGAFAGRLPPRRVRPLHVLLLAGLFLTELALSAWRVALTVLSPRLQLAPGILAFPLTVTSDFQITLLANLITLTPGTLSVDVSEDRRTLYVHALDCADPLAVRRDIAGGLERRIMEAFG